MNTVTFWSIIDEVNSASDHNDQEAILDMTERKLMKFSSNDIVDWHNIKKLYMDLAYRNDLWAACAATHSHYSDDGFIDFRSWLISKGKEVYMGALNEPDTLADIDIQQGTANFELYGYVACYSYTKKMALENEGLNSILRKYTSWVAENSAKLLDFYERYPKKYEEADQRMADTYIRVLSRKYDIHKVIDKQPLCKETVTEIMQEIIHRPDISYGWSTSDLPSIVPRLCEKYNIESEEHNSMDFKMEY